MESLVASRERFFHDTGLPRCVNPWIEELPRVQASDVPPPVLETVTRWDPCGPDAHANCPELDGRLRELKSLVGPRWRARVDSIYAGRGPYAGDMASSLKHRNGSVVFVSFTYSYAALGAFITLGDFATFLDAAGNDPHIEAKSDAIREGKLAAFAQLVAGEFRDSRIFVTTPRVLAAARWTSQWAELFIIGHEVAHLVMKDSSSRPDVGVQRQVDGILTGPSLAAELEGLSPTHLSEIRADVLSLLIVAGEYAKDGDLRTEVAAMEGALLALLAVGLVDGGWSPSQEHPSTLTRIAVVAKVAAQRILARSQEPEEERENLVRAIAMRLAYAAWLAETTINPVAMKAATFGAVLSAKRNAASASTALFLEMPFALFSATDGLQE